KLTVREVVRFYGSRDGEWLSALTHVERPWCAARAGLSDGEKSIRVIRIEALRDYYSQQAKALGTQKQLTDALMRGLDFLLTTPPEELDAIERDADIPVELEVDYLRGGGRDPWAHASDSDKATS